VSGLCLAVKTTSRQKFKSTGRGCNIEDKLPNFFVPANADIFPKDTWILLDDYFEIKPEDVLNRKFKEEINLIGILGDMVIAELLDCARTSPDVTGVQLARLD
jgi:hypothetical protein